jgi:hypothetical protein
MISYRWMRARPLSDLVRKQGLHIALTRYQPYIDPKALLARLYRKNPPTIDIFDVLRDPEHPLQAGSKMHLDGTEKHADIEENIAKDFDYIFRRSIQRQYFTVGDSPQSVAVIGVFYDEERQRMRFGILTVYIFIEITPPASLQRFLDKALENASTYLAMR